MELRELSIGSDTNSILLALMIVEWIEIQFGQSLQSRVTLDYLTVFFGIHPLKSLINGNMKTQSCQKILRVLEFMNLM